MQLRTILTEVFSINPDADAIEFDGTWWRWSDLDTVRAGLLATLDSAGLGSRTRVAGLMRNRPEMAATIVGVIASDRCLVTLNPSYPDDRLTADIRELRPAAVVGFAQDWDRPGVVEAVRSIGASGIELTGDWSAPIRLIGGCEHNDGAVVAKPAGPEDSIEMLTSGTTGTPKRVPIKYRTIERAVIDAGVFDKRDPAATVRLRGGVTILSAPFAHIAGIFGLLNTLAAGRRCALLSRFTVADWVDAVRRHRPKAANAPPAALRMILDAGIPAADLSSLVALRTGSAPVDPDLADEFEQRYGIPVLQNYSATEFAGAGAGWTLDDYRRYHVEKRGSVGRVNPGLSARVVDVDTGEPLELGAQGRLELRAPYLGDGTTWVPTTDLAVLDADNFLWIKGRTDSAIIRGGFKIAPEDVVRALEKHPAIREAAVVGVPDRRLGEVPAAAIILRAGADRPDAADLRAFLRDRLLPYQIPDMFKVVETLPRTPSLKVSQPELRTLLAAAESAAIYAEEEND